MTALEISSSYDFSIVVQRWAATWVDLLFFGGLLAVLLGVTGSTPVAGLVLWLVLLLLYYPVLEGFWGLTMGKIICGLIVVDEAGDRPGVGKAVTRTLLRLIEVNPLLFGGLPAGIIAATSKSHQRLGDTTAHTYVLRMSDIHRLRAGQPWYPPNTNDFVISSPDSEPPTYGLPAAPPPLQQPSRKRLPLRAMTVCAGLVTFLGAAGIIQGMVGFKTTKEQKEPITMDCAQFLKAPKDGWYHLTGCQYDLSQAAYEVFKLDPKYKTIDDDASDSEHVTDVYVPIYGADYKEGDRTPLLLRSSDSKLKSFVSELLRMNKANQKTIEKWADAHANEILAERDITGMVESDPYIATSVEDEIQQMKKDHLSGSFKMMKEGDYPMSLGNYSAVGGGMVFGFIALVLWICVLIRRRDDRWHSSNQPTVPPW